MSFTLRLLSSPTRSLLLSSVLSGACAAVGYQLGATDTSAYAEGFARARIAEVQASRYCSSFGEYFPTEDLEAQESSAPQCPIGTLDTGSSCTAPSSHTLSVSNFL